MAFQEEDGQELRTEAPERVAVRKEPPAMGVEVRPAREGFRREAAWAARQEAAVLKARSKLLALKARLRAKYIENQALVADRKGLTGSRAGLRSGAEQGSLTITGPQGAPGSRTRASVKAPGRSGIETIHY